ncbi:DedA family protein [Geodermatophilus sp. YIM 151500]|uniref:DedA family protein n=1 Tax=Geodermatophilus sp. YIM 151500 TaxID=2984531 RepID=UPI0021E4BD81|nr:DedA family protein [Geodermatophilus sp. YIM 151500]MCV2490121.1 DedA family protein [Geodermatophilus sp. YIM 151500]
MPPVLAAASDPGGITGFLFDAIDALGPVGVGLSILLETVIPPIPSEVILPLAGYLVQTGRESLLPVFLFATLGSLLGALALYWLGRALGPKRSRWVLDRMPLVDAEDVDKAWHWFERHGRSAVFFGRLVPIVRSFISVPAGVVGMPLPQFVLYTTLGSGLWNALLIGGGMLLGTQYQLVERYVGVLDYLIVAAVVGSIAFLVVRRFRKVRTQRQGPGSGA